MSGLNRFKAAATTVKIATRMVTKKYVVVKHDFTPDGSDERVLAIKKKEKLELVGEQDGWYDCRRTDGSGQRGYVPPAYCKKNVLEEEVEEQAS